MTPARIFCRYRLVTCAPLFWTFIFLILINYKSKSLLGILFTLDVLLSPIYVQSLSKHDFVATHGEVTS